jgi:ribonucleoside-diphosphate reductase alpha chain
MNVNIEKKQDDNINKQTRPHSEITHRKRINQTSSSPNGNSSRSSKPSKIYIVTSDGKKKILTYDKLSEYIAEICKKVNSIHLDVKKITNNVFPKLKTNNTINEVEEQIVLSTSEMATEHYDYPQVATWILISNLHENTHDDYLLTAKQLISNTNRKGVPAPIISESLYQFIEKNHETINSAFRYERDYGITVFGYRTLEKAYLKRLSNGQIIERPQHMYMRVAIALHYRTGRMDKILETYDLLSRGLFTHATPTLFNAGTTREQLSSCFLLGIDDDMEAIGECWKDCALISKYAGGIGINVSNIRIDGAYIQSTQGKSSGMRLLTVFNQIARYADQGGKRAGSIAIYLEPWHGDIFFFLDLKKSNGAETERARDLFLALTVNDIFMQRVKEDGIWSLMCPNDCPDLLNKYGTEFTEIYEKYEAEKKYIKQIRARDLWFKIMETQIETGVPYILFKDATNYKSNQINLGVINGSNLCIEIVEVSNSKEYSVCNLASICLPKFVKFVNGKPIFDYQMLYETARVITRNLNNIIDINFYPVDKTQVSNLKHRPIGIGIQGLADIFAMFKTSFDSQLARDLNKKIFETIYFGAMTESNQLAKEEGPYATYHGSPISQGKFQFNLWGLTDADLSGMWNWGALREDIVEYGVRNSLVTACMPTASTSQIQGHNECIEPYTANIYTRSTLAGNFYIINKYLMEDLMELGLWNSDMIDLIKYYDGSIQAIPGIPDDIKERYRTAFEILQKSIIEMSADRAPFIDQTQSLNLFIEKPSFARLNSCLFYAWELGLKTGIYYLRSKPGSGAQKFGIDQEKINNLIMSQNKINSSPQNYLTGIEEVDEILKSPVVCKLRPKGADPNDPCYACSG